MKLLFRVGPASAIRVLRLRWQKLRSGQQGCLHPGPPQENRTPDGNAHTDTRETARRESQNCSKGEFVLTTE